MLIISSTNRKNSKTKLVSLHYQSLLNSLGVQATIIDLADLPPDLLTTALYENSGKNPFFEEHFQAPIKNANKFIFVMPEYNGSFPGVLKLFTDCLKFPDALRGKKAALVGLSDGSQGAALALSHYVDILAYLGVNVLGQRVRMPKLGTLMSEGQITDKATLNLMELQARLFIDF